MAQVMMLHEVKVQEWDRTRDTFPAMLTASYLTSQGARMNGSETITGESILAMAYPTRKKSRTDPDQGAAGSWTALKSALKGTTEKRAQAARTRRPHHA